MSCRRSVVNGHACAPRGGTTYPESRVLVAKAAIAEVGQVGRHVFSRVDERLPRPILGLHPHPVDEAPHRGKKERRKNEAKKNEEAAIKNEKNNQTGEEKKKKKRCGKWRRREYVFVVMGCWS